MTKFKGLLFRKFLAMTESEYIAVEHMLQKKKITLSIWQKAALIIGAFYFYRNNHFIGL